MKRMNRVAWNTAAVYLAFGILMSSTGAFGQSPEPKQSTSGPMAPPAAGPKQPFARGADSGGGATQTIAGVPGYAWRHGCGPTAVGMVAGYWDTHGYPDLFPGDASTQTDDVNQGVASEGSGVRGSGTQRHYEDYSLPMDSDTAMIPDSSQTYPTGCHRDDCIADFMHTSWSLDGNKYGWSWSSQVLPSYTSYVALRNPSYSFACSSYYMSGGSLSWSVLTNEIAHHRPMVFLVDSDGDGNTDHFVTVVGYSDGPPAQYGCLDTWYPYDQVRWCTFQGMSSSYAWGVWGGWSFKPTTAPTVAPIILGDLTLQAGGVIQFGFTNLPGMNFTVYCTTNPALAFNRWTQLGSATETASGHYQFTDSSGVDKPVRFYRVTAP